MCKISIIVPVYNTEKYLEKCLESLINQSFTDIEIIVINDGSIDNSLNICNRYQKLDSRIKVISKKNEGVSVARNIGIDNAIGEYILFVDSDDWIEKDMCKELYNSIDENDSDICICNYILDNNCTSNLKNIYSYIFKNTIEKDEIENKLIIPLIETEDYENKHDLAEARGPWGKLFRRKVIVKNNIRFKKNLVIGEDFIFNLEFLVKASKVSVNKGFYYHYRIHAESAVRKYKDDFWKNYKELLESLEEFLIKNDLLIKSKVRYDKLKFKYFNMSITNECNKLNKKSIIEKRNYIKNICEDRLIKSLFEDGNKVIQGKINKINRYLARKKLYMFLYIINKVKLFLK